MKKVPFILLGEQYDEAGNAWQIGIPAEDFKTHAFITGTTGSGKSTLLGNLALQFFGLGFSTAILEPHGDLCTGVLESVPGNLLHRVLLFELDSRQPPSFPLMTIGLSGGIDAALDAFLSIVKMVEPASWEQSTRMREVLRNAGRVILDALGSNASIVALDRFLSDGEAEFRQRVLSSVSDENAKAREYCQRHIVGALDGEKSGVAMRDSILAAQRRIEVLVEDRRLRRTMALPPLGPQVNLRDLLADWRLILLPVNSARVGARVAGLTSMLFMQMAKAAFLGRVEHSERKQAAVIIDEFASMAAAETGGAEVGEITSSLLAEARKFGASIILATQSTFQLNHDLLRHLQVNTNIKVVLLVSDPEDAARSVTILGSDLVRAQDVRSLQNYSGYVRAMVNRSPKPPCMIRMSPPLVLDAVAEERVEEPQPPEVSDLWKKVVEKAKTATDPWGKTSNLDVIVFLRNLSESDWRQVVQDAIVWNRYRANQLLAWPEMMPDNLERVRLISRLNYGLPWWLREAHYWRERGWKERTRPARSGIVWD